SRGQYPRRLRARRNRRPVLCARNGRRPHREASGTQVDRRRPVRGLPAARQQRGDPSRVRRNRHPRPHGFDRRKSMTEAGEPQLRRTPRGGSARMRVTVYGAAGILLLVAVWEIYKWLGPTDGVVVWGTRVMPRTSDLAMPHVWDM